MSKKTKTKAVKPTVKTARNNAEGPKRLSKMGEFMKKYPKGYITIVDMRAVMK